VQLQVIDSIREVAVYLQSPGFSSDWYESPEKVMFAAVPQRLYCVHADRIAQRDLHLAQSNGREHGPPIRTNASARLRERRDAIADELWKQFMSKHPNFKGQLEEFHLQAVNHP
jgi:hypothetical protein